MIKEIDFREIPKEILAEAKKEKITFINGVVYCAYYKDDKLVAIAGTKNYKKLAKLKSAFIIKEFRCIGIYKELVEYRIDKIKKPINRQDSESSRTNATKRRKTKRAEQPWPRPGLLVWYA